MQNHTYLETDKYEKAIQEWSHCLSSAAILLNKLELEPYSKNTINNQKTIRGVLKPTSTEEIQSIVKIANTHRIPLYTISGGKNWGYGCSSPVVKDSFLLDLSQMKRIFDFDPDLGVVTIEPGVTQQDLYDFFQRQEVKFMVPTTGAGPSASILGNALERGYGLTPHSDHFEAVTSFQAVLPNGDLYIPALAEMGGIKINQLFKWGLGPYLDGIFTQGNFGIVTQGTILIAPQPEVISAFFFSLRNDSCLEGAVLAIRKLKQSLGSNIGAINLMNARRVLAMMEPAPKDAKNSQALVGEEAILRLSKKHNITEWTGFGALYGTKELTNASQKMIKKTLKPFIKRIHFVTEKQIEKIRWVKYLMPSFYQNNLKQKLDTLSAAIQNISGKPSQVALPLAYWRMPKQPDFTKTLNPAHDNCGLIWHAPLIPLTPEDVRKHVRITNEVCFKHYINPLITLTIFSGQCCDSTVPILFDKNNELEEFKAKKCHEELFTAEGAEGYLPYRLGIDMMNKFIKPTSPCWKLSQQLKSAIDPHQIISPGRYTPVSNSPSKIIDVNQDLFLLNKGAIK